ncbi:hypothetical protein BGZ61DRAFT_149309 [Ilyonectria robusta]|uniref:uncharacterized protein n=1 Tax=Ilyonectria robusta TaxID=1079257 RepID=UPI001E8E2520|nr:uncharacterized protein BGZ61DRAFT_149309 [Ilyonectria robusta]KAH8661281.1 hypothetical protein BGZ61DRAFT_149309 [Ilyonectria robusta]
MALPTNIVGTTPYVRHLCTKRSSEDPSPLRALISSLSLNGRALARFHGCRPLLQPPREAKIRRWHIPSALLWPSQFQTAHHTLSVAPAPLVRIGLLATCQKHVVSHHLGSRSATAPLVLVASPSLSHVLEHTQEYHRRLIIERSSFERHLFTL